MLTAKKIIITIGKYVGLIVVVAILTWQARGLNDKVISHVYQQPKSETVKKITNLNIQGKHIEKMAEAIDNAYKLTGISPDMIIAIIQSESAFRITAVSDKGYKGLMQTPWAMMKTNRAAIHVDILHGAEIFREKLLIARTKLKEKGKGDLEANVLLEALSLYKGGAYETAKNITARNIQARREAEKTYKYYIALKANKFTWNS